MEFLETVKKSRSYRRFDESKPVDFNTLKELVELARFSPSSGNIQGLKFYLSSDPAINEKIFETTMWASYLKNWKGPEKGERPTAYIIILGDTEIHSTIQVDVGIVAQSIMLGAASLGIGGCMIGSFNRKKLQERLHIDEKFELPLVLALGYPKEQVVLEDVKDDEIKYWRDDAGVHHVPKRSMEELIVNS